MAVRAALNVEPHVCDGTGWAEAAFSVGQIAHYEGVEREGLTCLKFDRTVSVEFDQHIANAFYWPKDA